MGNSKAKIFSRLQFRTKIRGKQESSETYKETTKDSRQRES